MAETVLVAGTASHVGKSTVAAGLCRLLARQGVAVAPFKAQNMSNNAQVVLSPTGDWGEIGVSQYAQAEAARMTPTTDLNPVLLKPHGEGNSQLVIQGEVVGHVRPGEYYEKSWGTARQAAVASFERLAADHDVIVAEGAGSIAEINLHHRDLANVETARFADAQIILVVDIERGGAFASLYGTLELMPDDLRDRVAGAVITKFRGDEELLEPGLETIADRTGVPVIGVLPYDDPDLPDEDSVALPDERTRAVRGNDDGVPEPRTVRIGVPRLPRLSNATDLGPLEREPGVRIAFVPPDADLEALDAIVLPGTKNTADDLLALTEAGFDERIRRFEGPIVGLCGGYQLLGERLTHVGVESTRTTGSLEGLGVLPVETRFEAEKQVERVIHQLDGAGPLAGADGSVTGYEIHMGRSHPLEAVAEPMPNTVATDQVFGTYLHGLFENGIARRAFVDNTFRSAGKIRPSQDPSTHTPYADAADLIADHVNLDPIGLR